MPAGNSTIPLWEAVKQNPARLQQRTWNNVFARALLRGGNVPKPLDAHGLITNVLTSLVVRPIQRRVTRIASRLVIDVLVMVNNVWRLRSVANTLVSLLAKIIQAYLVLWNVFGITVLAEIIFAQRQTNLSILISLALLGSRDVLPMVRDVYRHGKSALLTRGMM